MRPDLQRWAERLRQANLIEALRWVMGESSYKNMPASGSRSRSPGQRCRRLLGKLNAVLATQPGSMG